MAVPLPPLPPVLPPPALISPAVAPPAVVRPYDPPAQDWDAGHRGLDLARTGTVRSLTPGTVAFAGRVGDVPVVAVALPDGRRVTYQPVLASVRVGQPVARGQVIGRPAASGGHCGAGHGCIHVGLRDDRRYWDPAVLLARAPAVLKPY